MRLIDADDFGNRMYHEAFEKDSDLQKWDSGCWIRYKLFENVLREQPTIQPVATDTNVGDTISRQAALDAFGFSEKTRKYGGDHSGYNTMMLYEIQGILEGLPSAQPEQRWIPCSERLPEVHEAGDSFVGVYMKSYPVLVYGVPEGEEECSFHVAIYCDDLDGYTYWSTELDGVTIDGVIAWMPLPKPHKEGETT